jgi:hypothetical protein
VLELANAESSCTRLHHVLPIAVSDRIFIEMASLFACDVHACDDTRVTYKGLYEIPTF